VPDIETAEFDAISQKGSQRAWEGPPRSGLAKRITKLDRRCDGRIWRITLRRAGIFSNTSVTSSPSLAKRVPPHSGQAKAG
jgi:hypothetical protein